MKNNNVAEVATSNEIVNKMPFQRVKSKKIKGEKYFFKNGFEGKEKKFDVQRRLGFWEGMKIYGTPEEIKEDLKFTQLKVVAKQVGTEIKSSLKLLKS
jgi:hypothetical protein